ncbi:MAG: metallophosphoesterase [Cyanobacteria bacterium P01_D01_bin.14]
MSSRTPSQRLSRRRFLLLSALTLGACSSTVQSRPDTTTTAAELVSTPVDGETPPQTQQTQTRPATGPEGMFAPVRGDVRAVVLSDMNSSYGSTDYRAEVLEGVRLLPEWQPDLVICAGDMIAGQSVALTRPEVDAMWTAFDEKILTPIREMGYPYALTLGNHDASSYQFKGEYVFDIDRAAAADYWAPYIDRLDLQYVDKAGFPFYYSFKQNDIFYMIWDASSANVAAEQVAWADATLASEAAQSAKLRIAMGHLPMYAVSQGRDRAGEILNSPDALRELLERHHVHTYISGHHHVYFPGHVNELEFLHCGALGSGPRTWLNRTDAAFQTLTVMDIFFDTGEVTYTTYNMNNRELVTLEQLPRQIVGPTGRVLREDIELVDLTEAEVNQPYVPSLH